MDRWTGKIAVITGASSGIGSKTALTLADKGIIVVGLARRVDKIKELATKSKGVIHSVKCDVAKEEDILNAFKFIERSIGGVDILINNAGISSVCSLTNGPTHDMKSVLDVNVLGLCLCTREAIKSMKKRGDNGHIIHINSMAGHRIPDINNCFFGTYPASKHAVTALTECLRRELMSTKSHIKVTSISPGAVYTEMAEQICEQMNVKPTQAMINTMLQDEDIVEAIMYTLGTRPGVQVHEMMIQPLVTPWKTEE